MTQTLPVALCYYCGALIKGETCVVCGCSHPHHPSQDDLKSEIKTLREALEWYGDRNNYQAHVSRYGQPIPAEAEEDKGRRARAALDKKGAS